MNGKLILFSAIMTATVGAVIGLGLAEMKSSTFADRASAHSPYFSYAIVGISIGFLSGGWLESVRELKKQQDNQEKLWDYLHTYLGLRDSEH